MLRSIQFKLAFFVLFVSALFFGQCTPGPQCTPNLGLNIPIYNQGNWNALMNQNWERLDILFACFGSGTCTGVPVINISPSSLTFPNTVNGQLSVPQNLTITNSTGATTNISPPTVGTSNFSLSLGNNCNGLLANTASCVVGVTFTPTVVGALTDSISITTSFGTQAVALSGTAISATFPTASSISVTPLTPSLVIPTTQQMNASLTRSDSSMLNWTPNAWWAVTGGGGGTLTPSVSNSCAPSYTTNALSCGPWTVATGDKLVCVDTVNATTKTLTFADTLGNSWTLLTANTVGSGTGGTNGYQQIAYATVSAGGSDTLSITESAGTTYAQSGACIDLANVGIFDVSSSAVSSSSTTISSGSFTTTASGDFVFAGFADAAASGPFTLGSGYTLLGTQNGYAAATETKVLGAAASYSATMTNSQSSSTGLGFAAAFKAAAGSASVASITNPGGVITPLAAGTATVEAAAADLVQAAPLTTAASNSVLSAQFAVPQKGGDLNAVFILWPQTAGSCTALSSVIDTAGNTYTAAGAVTSGNGLCGNIYYTNVLTPASGSTNNITNVTVTWASAVANPIVVPLEYSGLLRTSVFDVYAGATGQSASGTNPLTTVNATDLIASVCYNTGQESANNGTTVAGNVTATVFETVLFSAGAYTPSCTLGTAGTSWLMLSIALGTPGTSTALTVSSSGGPTTGPVRYISATGSDANNGQTATTPWLTWAHAAANISAGYTITALPGTMNASNSGLMTLNCTNTGAWPNGTSAAPITIITSQERQTVIDGQGYVEISTEGCNYYTIRGFVALNESVNLWGTSGCDYSNVEIDNSSNIVFKRNLIEHTNQYCNAHGIAVTHSAASSSGNVISDNEIYDSHRHGIFVGYGSAEVERNYVNPRNQGDVAGCQGTSCQSNGHFGIACYPCENSLFENNIVETDQVPIGSSAGPAQPAFDQEADYSPGGNTTNSWIGNISLNNVIAWRAAARCEAGETCAANLQPYNNTITNLVAVNTKPNIQGTTNFLYPRSTFGTVFNHTTILGFSQVENGGNTSGLIADYQNCASSPPGCGGGTYSVELENSYLVNVSTGVTQSGCGTGCSVYTTTFDHLAFTNLSVLTGGGATVTNQNNLSSNALGSCSVWVPTGSPLHGVASDGGDEAANVLYETVGGTTGTTPIWSIHTCLNGQNSCAAFNGALDSLGINNKPGQSLYDIGSRLNVNQNGCSWPSGYTPN